MTLHSKGGFTLIEALIGLVFLSVCVLGGINIMVKNNRGIQASWDKTVASLKAQDLLETMKRAQWDKIGSAGHVLTVNATLGQDDPGDFNDVDDWDGYTDQSGIFQRTVNFRFVKLQKVAGEWKMLPSEFPTDIKQATVSVQTKNGTPTTITYLFVNVEGATP